jgi:hypothetical protein
MMCSTTVLVGYGKGALAVIDPVKRTKAADIPLRGHPEGFQIDETGTQVFVNVPDAREIEIVDLATEANRSLPMQGVGSNFRMARSTTELPGPSTSPVVSPAQDRRWRRRFCADGDR